MSETYFTSDTHFGHRNIIKYCNRPFSNEKEMDEMLIINWNARVKPNDEVFHLGDFGFGREEYLARILNRLNGIKYFVRGNHDRSMRGRLLDHFESVREYAEINVQGQKMVICHYPLVTWNKARHGAWMLHGHCHHTLDYMNEHTTRIDVGVDGWDYAPVSMSQLRSAMSKKTYKIVDHHGKDIEYTTLDEL